MADLNTLQTRLQEAENAYHDLMTGKKAVSVSWSDGQSIEYRKSDSAQLEQYIQFLKRQIAELNGGKRRRPIQLWPV